MREVAACPASEHCRPSRRTDVFKRLKNARPQASNRFARSGERARVLFIFAVCLTAACAVTIAVMAANPASGTLSVANPRITYTAGPNVVSNPSGLASLNCTSLPCDQFALTVDVPASYEETHQVRIHISWPSPVEDYDLNVSNVGSSGNNPGIPETVIAPARSGSYTVQVVPFAVHGGTFTGTITLEEKPAATGGGDGGGTVSAGPSPRFETYNPPPNSGLGQSAGEPSIGFGRPSAQYPGGRYMFVASLQTLRVSFDDCSSPARATWEDVTAPTTGIATLDPILESDKDGSGRTFVSQLGPKTSFLAFTDDDGETWTPSQGAPINPGVDHQTVGVGPFAPGLPDGIGGYPNAVYYASQDIAVAQLGISRDGGLTFGPAIPMYNLTQCGGLHGHVTVGPDGTVYVPNKGCTPGAAGVEGGGAQGFAVSEDEGTTFAIRTVPGSGRGNNDPSLGVGRGDVVKSEAGAPAGRLYFGYGENGRAMIATSDDKGRTWSTPVDVGAPFGIKNIVFPQVVAGDDDRAAFMFLGTPTGGNYQDTANFRGEWHMYISTTYDGGRTWTTVDTTPNDPVQLGSICTAGTTCGADRNLLDFNDLKMDYEGRIVGAYADGCVGCTSPSTSRSDLATIVRQSGGKRLLAQYDPREQAVPLAPRVNSVARVGDVVRLSWSEPDNGGSPITGYNVYRKEGQSGAEGLIGTSTKTTFDDRTAAADKQYFYRVTAVNANGESGSCGSQPIGDAPPAQSPCALPGVTVVTDAAGDNTTGATQRDIRSVSFAELYDPSTARNKLFVTIKAGGFAPTNAPPPLSRYTVYFTRQNADNTATEWFVSMVTDDATSPGTPVFRYGHTEPGTGGVRSLVTDGRADRGTFNADGTIVIEISNPTKTSTAANSKAFPELRAGEVIGNVNAATQQSSGALLINDDSTGAGTYTLKGNAFCRPNSAPVAALSASPASGNAPLAVTLDASASTDPDTAAPADTVASYTFDFGDGSEPVTQSSPVITHTYAAGNYRATVRVTDSRGKQSANTAGVNLEVSAPRPPEAPTELVVTSTTSTSISLSWSDNSDNETGFKLERCQGANCTNFEQLPAFGADITTYTDSGLKANAQYRYRIRAFNGAGNSAYSNTVNARARR
jgi:hypothetical protein